MSVQLLEKLATLGKELGYAGVELREWVSAQVKIEEKKSAEAIEREERKLQREEHKKEVEAEKKEKIKRDELALEKAKLDQQERFKQLELQQQVKLAELKVAEKKVENSNGEDDNESDSDGSQVSHASSISNSGSRRKSGPKLPHFDDTKDNIDSYLRRFERYASLQNWPKGDWAIYLSALLKGRALEVYSRLTETEARSYTKLKAALLRKYQLTVEGFRRQFYAARREKDETASQFVCRIEGYLDRWVQLAEIEESFKGLRDLIVREQFLSVCEEHLAIYLRERNPKELPEVIKLADIYLDARLQRDAKDRRIKQPFQMKPTTSERPAERVVETTTSSERSEDKSRRTCYLCHQVGHMRKQCPLYRQGSKGSTERMAMCQEIPSADKKSKTCSHDLLVPGTLELRCGCQMPYVGCLSENASSEPVDRRLPTVTGKVNGHVVSVLRDTGCTTAVVCDGLVTEEQRTGQFKCYRVMDGSIGKAEVAVVDVESPVFTGKVECLCLKSPACDLVIGNIPGASRGPAPEVVAVTTRAQAKAKEKPKKPLIVPVLQDLQVSTVDLQRFQRESADLQKGFELARAQESVKSGKVATVRYQVCKCILYRVYQVPGKPDVKQLMVPKELRRAVLGLAHDSVMSGHEGIHKTTDRVMSNFWWPGIRDDVTRYCRSCDVCQRTIPRGRVSKAPLQKMPIIGVPFQRIGVDLVGPITPASSSGKRYILTVVDYATRYPEAVALSGISTEDVAEALCTVYSRVGVPTHVVHDQGSQFMSDVMAEVSRLLSIRNLVSTPYHPQTNGLVERFNGTLKAMLKKLCAERPRDWDRYLESVLFAYREVKQESTGFSPFELLYGRTVRGPMAILRELWTKEQSSDEVRTTYQYVLNLRNRLEETCGLVKDSLTKSSVKAKKHFDRKARMRELKAGDLVLILLPTAESKLLMQWKGPYTVTERVGLTDYRVRIGDTEKVYHINMLKRYFEAANSASNISTSLRSSEDTSCVEELVAALVEEDGDVNLPLPVSSSSHEAGETVADVHISDELGVEEREQLQALLLEYQDIFSDRPGVTNIVEHRIQLVDDNPIRCKPYPVPHALKSEVIEEVREMERLGIIEKSDSPYTSPLLMVKKKDGRNRPVIDFRRLNKITVFDAEPMPNVDDIYARLSTARYFSKLDFCKGYWQIPTAIEDRPKTAFCTPIGLYQFVRMPFGLQNACATYGRMMRRLLDGMEQTDNFVDDVLTFTDEWQRHLHELRDLFCRVRQAGLTVKPSKCFFGYVSIEYVGHVVGQGQLRTMEDKVSRIVNAPEPRTKTQLRAFLGLAGYYRRFVPSYAMVAAPLTDLLRKGAPNKLEWERAQDIAFSQLKAALSSEPVLRLPDSNKQFIVRTDASDTGLGAVLLQEHEDGIFPVMYLSRKLNAAERNYSVIERECLAIVWAISKLQLYLYGRSFVLQTDHRPLLYLDQAKLSNPRVMRWALSLQPYRYRTESIRGSDNVGADYLSRSAPDVTNPSEM